MTEEYEKNLLDPGQKVREDVEAEYIPRIKSLEDKVREKEQFCRDIYETNFELRADNTRLREVSNSVLLRLMIVIFASGLMTQSLSYTEVRATRS